MIHAHSVKQQITVEWDFPVVFTRSLFAAANPILPRIYVYVLDGNAPNPTPAPPQ